MKKIIPFILILIILVGLFSPMVEVRAEEDEPKGLCQGAGNNIVENSDKVPITQKACKDLSNSFFSNIWIPTTLTKPSPGTDLDLGCSFGLGLSDMNLKGCVAELFYIIFTASAFVAELGGRFLDFFVYYSTNSTSYDNPFISKGWGAVRDVANIFFIITLLYIAIKTVLSLDSHGSKKMIGYVIIIALIINFSLFTTKVIIDSSNILAKIFYNNIVSVDATNETLDAEAGGQKSISIGLIQKFNPQKLITQDTYVLNPYSFIFLTILLIAITLYTAYVFFAVAVLFVARVVSLWLAMIFSPLAFISYAVPFDVPFGHKEWWDDLLKNAFLAPIFIFFLYIIVLFTGFLENIISYTDSPNLTSEANLMQSIMSVVIPFAILVMLLMKAKSLVVKYSGKIGEAVVSGAKMIGGLALGVGAGAVAMGGSQTAGRLARNTANNDELKKKAAAGDRGAQRKLALANTFAGKSFDLRDTGVGKFAAKRTGMNFNEGLGAVGLSTEKLKGGRMARDKEELEKHEAKLKTYELSKSEALKQDDIGDKQNIRAQQYETDKKDAKNYAKESKFIFNEQNFKDDYEHGRNLRQHLGIDKIVEEGGIEKGKKAADINKERRQSYALSLENPGKKIEDKKAIKRSWEEAFMDSSLSFRAGARDPRTIAATAAATALSGPIGLLTPLIGGLAFAIKDLAAAQARRIPVFGEHKEIVAGVRKGVSPDEKLSALIKKAAEGDKHAVAEIVKDAKTPEPKTPSAEAGAEAHPTAEAHH